MDNKRLRQLQRQKELILEQLEWINQEIDQEATSTSPSASPKASRLAEAFPEDKPVSQRIDLETVPQPQVAADLYQELGPDTKNAAAETKRGCLLVGAIALTAFAALATYVLFFY